MLMVQNYADPERARASHARRSRRSAERAADRITAEVHRLLHSTFITPIDRDQIHGLINAMDDILDLLQDSSEVMSLYDLQKLPARRDAAGRRCRCAAASACSTW